LAKKNVSVQNYDKIRSFDGARKNYGAILRKLGEKNVFDQKYDENRRLYRRFF
jgi:hypothetical protein